jgi:apolipoprotein D and lipocalin family protein
MNQEEQVVKFLSALKVMLMSCLFIGCAHSFDRTVDYVDRDRFMGSWYVQAGRFTSFEDNAFNAVENYSWDEQNKKIIIDFHFNQGSLNGALKKIPQKAWITNEVTNAVYIFSYSS